MSGVVLEQVNQVVDFIQVVDSSNSEFLGICDSCAEEESANSAEAVDSELH
jgi:protein-arginine kinase activator protein McsA